MLSIPYTALTADLTGDSHQRSVLTPTRMTSHSRHADGGGPRPCPRRAPRNGPARGFSRWDILCTDHAITVITTFLAVRERTERPPRTPAAGRSHASCGPSSKTGPSSYSPSRPDAPDRAQHHVGGSGLFFKYNLRAEASSRGFIVLMSARRSPFLLPPRFRAQGQEVRLQPRDGPEAALSPLSSSSPSESRAHHRALRPGRVRLGRYTFHPGRWFPTRWSTRSGKRAGDTRMLYGFFFFSFKLSVAFPGLIVGTVLSLSGYTPAGPQGPEALSHKGAPHRHPSFS